MTSGTDRAALVNAMRLAAQEAGEIALAYFREGDKTSAGITYKDGGSPVSAADLAVDVHLRERLNALLPEAGWLSEETTDTNHRLDAARLFIVDPIDGTRAFIKGDRRWAISLALVENRRPSCAVLHLPALELTYSASAGEGALLNGTKLNLQAPGSLSGSTFAGPAKVLDALAGRGLAIERAPRVPSLAYRLALVASGEIAAAIASTDAYDWDIAAADLIVRESGGLLTGLDGRPPVYNLPVPRHGVLAAAPAQIHGDLIARLRQIEN